MSGPPVAFVVWFNAVVRGLRLVLAVAIAVVVAAAGVASAAPSDADAAAAATLGLPDFPASGGWDGKALGTSGADVAAQQDQTLSAFPTCKSMRAAFALIYSSPNAATQYQNATSSVSDLVAVLRGERDARKYADAYASASAGRCLHDYWTSLYDATAGAKVVVDRLPPGLKRSGATGVRLRSDYTQDGAARTAYWDFLALRKGRAVASFTFANPDAPFPLDLETKLLAAVAGRLPR